jgi:heavy metal sensor kinase
VTLVTVVFAVAVYVRSHRLAHEALESGLTLRARSLADALKLDHDGLEWDVSMDRMPEYMQPGSGEYFLLYYPTGEVFARSPSLDGQLLPTPPDWKKGDLHYQEIESGPDGLPLAVVTRSFLVRLDMESEDDGEGLGWTPPPEEGLRFRMQVAADTTARDRGLAGIALFLVLTGAGLVVAATLLGILVSQRVLKPVRRMTKEAEALSPADLSRRLGPDTVVTELHSLAVTLNGALDRLNSSLESQRRFTSDASHELRTPISVLLANAEYLLRRPRKPEEYIDGLDRQHRIAVRMKEMTENLLTLARAESDAEGFEREPVAMAKLLSAQCEDLQAIAREREITLTCNVPPDVTVLGDARFLAQLLTNLVGNALKFTPGGGHVAVRVESENGFAVLSVEDDGPGIAREHQERIFDRFHRGEPGSNGQEGAGLGLAIVSWIARTHGGEVTVQSAPGEGATFSVRLPELRTRS